MEVTLVHTSDSHCVTFDHLRDRIAPDVTLTHVVRPRWLARAQKGIDASLDVEITGTISRFAGPVLCTCSTVGAVAEAAGAVRVDWPMMQRAAQINGPIVLAHCLDSTLEPSRSLLQRAMRDAEVRNKILSLPLTVHWKHFEAGDFAKFHAMLSRDIRQVVDKYERVGCVVLAQVSMAPVEADLADLKVPVFGSPELAFRAVIAQL